MPSMRVAVIDVGSNTARLLVASVSPPREVEAVADERAFLGLGAEIATRGRLRKRSIATAADTAGRFARVARKAGAERLETIVTAPGRQGAEPERLLAALREATGAPVRVLTAEQEGTLAYDGAVARAGVLPGVVGVVDVGGGSTEIVVGEPAGGGVTWVRSLDIGSLRLTSLHLPDDPPAADQIAAARAVVAAALERLEPPTPDLVFGTGGSSRALGKVLGRRYDAADLDAAATDLGGRSAAERAEAFGLHPIRAESIVAGAIVLAEVSRLLDRPFELARGGLREGAALQLAAVAAAAA
jgi:exopolyphosphatase/guanosine-5'-triphosphate,3'-diphosphate pyrophosphatase